jgi:hypothetical protein
VGLPLGIRLEKGTMNLLTKSMQDEANKDKLDAFLANANYHPVLFVIQTAAEQVNLFTELPALD